jgi:glyoxylase-like metal-dependent hydrolase (beta-lactamase superfamily II)
MQKAGALDANDVLILAFQSYIVKTPHHTILIDSCIGNDKPRPQRPKWSMKSDDTYMRALAAAGFSVGDIDYVMCTHLHVDHVGWNTRRENGRWVPTFPNARYLFAKREYAHWEGERKTQGEGVVNGGSFDDSVLPVVEAGKAVMIESDHQPDPLLTIKDYPGHTPGSIAINLKDGGQQASFAGDIMHHPIQVYHPDWSSQFCWDQAMAARSRRQLLEDCVEANALLCPAHFAGANAGYVKPERDSFRIEWDRQ